MRCSPSKSPVRPKTPGRAIAGGSVARHLPLVVLTFFTPATELAACGCCGEKLLGDIVSCPGCGQQVHSLCTQGAKCFQCVCRVCNPPPGVAMRPCKSCKHRVHVACTVQVPYHVEVTCKVCAPKPRLSPRPMKKQVKRRFNSEWKVGRPWLHFENGVMSCLACRADPQMGLQKVWLDGTPQAQALCDMSCLCM